MISTLKFFVVDDDNDSRFLTGKYLQRLSPSIEVLEFSSAEAALAAFALHRPSAVITDHFLPGMSGIEFIRHVRTGAPTVPILMHSGMDTVQGEALAAGADIFLSAPGIAEFKAALQHLIELACSIGADRQPSGEHGGNQVRGPMVTGRPHP